MNSFSDRLKIAIAYADSDQSKLAKAVGISQASISHLCKNGTRSGYTVQIAQELKVNPEWLISGVGEMETPDKPAPPVIDLERWQKLNPKLRALIEDVIDKYQANLITINDVSFLQSMTDKFSANNQRYSDHVNA